MGLWSWFKGLFRKKEAEKPPLSLVFFLREPRYLDQQVLTEAVRKAFGVDLSQAGPDSSEFVAGGDGLPTYVVQLQGRFLLVHNFDASYIPDKGNAAKQVPDLRLRQAILEHTAWFSVDALFPPVNGEDPYLAVGKLLAEFADDNCLAIYAPALHLMNPYDPDVENILRSPDPLAAVRQRNRVPVISMSEDDPQMKAAVAEARARWPEFVAAFERRQPAQTFAVKAPFTEGDTCEFMWVIVTAIENGQVYGKLDSNPMSLKKIQYGSHMQVSAENLNDWVYQDNGETKGGFTISVVAKAMQQP